LTGSLRTRHHLCGAVLGLDWQFLYQLWALHGMLCDVFIVVVNAVFYGLFKF